MFSALWEKLDPGFVAPEWLAIGLVAVLLLAAMEVMAHRRRERAARTFAASHLVAALTASISPTKRRLKAFLLVIATGLLFLALARPYLFFDWSDETRSGLDVLLAVDCSRSMMTEDVRPNRLERAKLAISDFADRVPENRLGLIAFAGDAFLECPLTLDHEAFQDAVRDLDTDTIPRPGTDIATAIDEAVDALRSQPNNMKFLILVTDGEDLEGRAISAARNAAQSGLRIFTIGVGTAAGDRIPDPVEQAGMPPVFHHDASGQEITSHLDENTLRQIALATGGAYVGLGQRGEGLDEIYSHYIESLPKQNLEEKRQKIHIERFEWPLALAILFLMWEFLVNERARESTPAGAATAPLRSRVHRKKTRDAIAVPLAILALLALMNYARASDTENAERDYKSGKYEDAMQGYEKAATNNPARDDYEYNRGAAAYKAGEYSEAEEAFRETLETPDLGLQEKTYYNLGNTEYQHGEAMRKVSSRKTVKLWEQALHSYECALQLKDSDDTKHNYAIVKKKLEELKEQRKQRGKKGGSSSSGQSGESGQPSAQGQGGESGQGGSGDSDDDDDDDSSQGKQSGGNGNPNQDQKPGNGGDKAQEQQGQAQGDQQKPMRAYSGTRSQDLQDPGIKSRQDAENLLDSLKDDQRRVSARSMSGTNAEPPPPPSGKDW